MDKKYYSDEEPLWDEPFNHQLIAERKLLQRVAQPEVESSKETNDVYKMIKQHFASEETSPEVSEVRDMSSRDNKSTEKSNEKISGMGKGLALQDVSALPLPHCSDALLNDTQQIVDFLCSPKSPNPILIVGEMSSDNRMIFIYADGFYQRISLTALKGIVKRILPLPYQTRDKIERIIYSIQTELPQLTEDQLNCDEDIINFQNGIFHFSSETLTPHSPNVYSTIQIPCYYTPNRFLAEAPVFHSFLKTLTNENQGDQAFIMEYIGAILSNVPGYRFKKALILYGPGDTGKSQLRELIQYLVGLSNCHTLDLDKMEHRFGAAQVFGKRLVGAGDLPSGKIKELAIFKAITGGDQINGEFKGENAFSFHFRGFLLYCCNKLPKFSGDQGKHVYNRFNIIHTVNVIPPEQQDKDLLKKMQAEADVIVCVALNFFRRVIKREYRFTESQNMIHLREEYAAKNDTIARFLNEVCNLSTGRVKRSEFYLVYVGWCKLEHIQAEPKHTVFETLAEVYGIAPFKSGEHYLPLSFKKATDFSEDFRAQKMFG